MVEKSHDIVPLFLSQQNRHVTKAGERSRVDHVPWHHASGVRSPTLINVIAAIDKRQLFPDDMIKYHVRILLCLIACLL